MFVIALIALVALASAMTIRELPVTEEEHVAAFDAMRVAHSRTYAKGDAEYEQRYRNFKDNVARIQKTVRFRLRRKRCPLWRKKKIFF